MLKIAVVEDQTEVRESLCQFIRQYAGEQGLQAEVEPFADGAVIAEVPIHKTELYLEIF